MTFFRVWHPGGTAVVDAQGLVSVGPVGDRLPSPRPSVLACAPQLLRPSDALQPGQALAPAVTVRVGMWDSEQALFANFVYCLIRKTRLVLANSGSSHIWGKGVTWIRSRTQFSALLISNNIKDNMELPLFFVQFGYGGISGYK